MWDEATEHHHRVSDGKTNTHGTCAGRGANTGERLMLPIGVKASEAADAAITMAIEEAGNNRDIARFDIAMKCEMVTGASVVSVGPTFASRTHRRVANFREELSCLRVTIKCSLLTAAARADETARRISASHFVVMGGSNSASDSAVEAKTRFHQESPARLGTGKVIKYGTASIFHQGGFAYIA